MHLNWNARLCKEIFTLRNRRCQTLKQTFSLRFTLVTDP